MTTVTTEPVAPFTDWRNFEAPTQVIPEVGNTFLPLSEIDEGDNSNSTRALWGVPPTTKNHTYLGLSSEERRERKIRSESYKPVGYTHPVYPNYRRLELTNRDRWIGKWENKAVLYPDDDWRLADSIMCQLDMNSSQRSRTLSLLSALDRKKLGISTRKVVFRIAMVVCWLDGRKTSPRQKPWDPEFDRMARACGVFKPLREFEKSKHMLRQYIDTTNRRPVPDPPSHDSYKSLN